MSTYGKGSEAEHAQYAADAGSVIKPTLATDNSGTDCLTPLMPQSISTVASEGIDRGRGLLPSPDRPFHDMITGC